VSDKIKLPTCYACDAKPTGLHVDWEGRSRVACTRHRTHTPSEAGQDFVGFFERLEAAYAQAELESKRVWGTVLVSGDAGLYHLKYELEEIDDEGGCTYWVEDGFGNEHPIGVGCPGRGALEEVLAADVDDLYEPGLVLGWLGSCARRPQREARGREG